MSRKQRFLWGAIGSQFPQVVRAYEFVTIGNAVPDISLEYVAMYLVAAALFATSAGLLAVAWRTETPYMSLSVGVAFPLVVSAMLQAAPSVPLP